MSPQGTHLVYWANNQLYLDTLDQLRGAKVIAGTENAREPFFSADGQWIGFYQGDLKKISIRGGAVIRVSANPTNLYGASWNADDELLYGAGRDGIWRVAGAGGMPTRIVAMQDGELADGPQRLPDGTILFTLLPKGATSWDNANAVVVAPDGTRTVVVRGGRDAKYLSAGYLTYGINGVLYAAPFDASAHALRAGAVPIAEGVMDADVRTGAMHYDISTDGTLTYVAGPSGERSTLLFLDRDGHPGPLPQEPREYAHPRISPDGTRVAVEVGQGDDRALFIYDLQRFALTRLTPQRLRNARFPLWTPKGDRIVFFSDGDGTGAGLFSIPADGTGNPARLTTSTTEQRPYTWSADGSTLILERGTLGVSVRGIYVMSMDGAHTTSPLLSASAPGEPALSPDGRWLAYGARTNDLPPEVFVQPFPDVNKGRWLIASNASAPIWSRDGRELYFISGGRAMTVAIATQPTFTAGTPRAMFELGPYYRGAEGTNSRQWDLDPNESRFLTLKPGDAPANSDAGKPQIVVVRNWFEELKRLAQAK